MVTVLVMLFGDGSVGLAKAIRTVKRVALKGAGLDQKGIEKI